MQTLASELQWDKINGYNEETVIGTLSHNKPSLSDTYYN